MQSPQCKTYVRPPVGSRQRTQSLHNMYTLRPQVDSQKNMHSHQQTLYSICTAKSRQSTVHICTATRRHFPVNVQPPVDTLRIQSAQPLVDSLKYMHSHEDSLQYMHIHQQTVYSTVDAQSLWTVFSTCTATDGQLTVKAHAPVDSQQYLHSHQWTVHYICTATRRQFTIYAQQPVDSPQYMHTHQWTFYCFCTATNRQSI